MSGTEEGCNNVVSIHQEIADNSKSVGLFLMAGAITWMATANVSLSVDQYVSRDAPLEEDGVGTGRRRNIPPSPGVRS